MVDREVFDRRLAYLERLVGDLRRLVRDEGDRLTGDRAVQAQAERWTQLAVEVCLDLAHHLISDRGWRTPDSYRGAFAVLGDEGVLDPELARRMGAWAGLRNLLVHLYLDVDHARLAGILRRDLGDLERFAQAARREADRG